MQYRGSDTDKHRNPSGWKVGIFKGRPAYEKPLGRQAKCNRHKPMGVNSNKVIDSNFPVRTDRSTLDIPLSFQTKNQLELGVELIWQLQMNSYTLWIAAANNLSGYILKKPGAAKVFNQRFSGASRQLKSDHSDN
ncbi:MAG: hypothetical protein H7318_12410 [Oligoflexus sp.]|nr:hypothetical protein [Oligoflexus sp.]